MGHPVVCDHFETIFVLFKVYCAKEGADGREQAVLIGEMTQPVAGAAPAQIDEGTLDDSRTYSCVWRKLR